MAAIVLCCLILLPVLGLAHALRNPFAETTTLRSSPTVLRSITALSRYEADNGTFQVVVDLQKRSPHLPSFIEGSQTIFVGEGTDIAYVDFSQLSGRNIRVSADRSCGASGSGASWTAGSALGTLGGWQSTPRTAGSSWWLAGDGGRRTR